MIKLGRVSTQTKGDPKIDPFVEGPMDLRPGWQYLPT